MWWLRCKRFLRASISVPVWLLLVVAGGIGVGGALWLQGRLAHPWLELLKDKEGVVAGIHVQPQKIPRDILKTLPTPEDNARPSFDQIKALAERHELYQSWQTNPHLCFDDSVINYWANQNRPAWELELQFLSRQLVLEAAERDHVRIPYPGDLSKWAERVYPILLKKAQEK